MGGLIPFLVVLQWQTCVLPSDDTGSMHTVYVKIAKK